MNEKKFPENERDYFKTELFEAISHPIRIKILKLLEKKPLGFSDLKRSLNISSSGNLTHHLNKLINLIKKNSQGNYTITNQGYEALLTIKFINYPSQKWMATTNALTTALIFYSIFLTTSIFFDWKNSFGISDVFLPLIGLLITSLLFFVIRFFYTRTYRKSKIKIPF